MSKPTLSTNPFRWNPSHWTRQRDWKAPESSRRGNCILVSKSNSETEIVYDEDSGVVSRAEYYFQPAGQMSKGEILVDIDSGLNLEEARARVLEIIHRDIPEDEIEEGHEDVRQFMKKIT